MAMQRIANPWISVRLRDPPPDFKQERIEYISTHIVFARVVESVDTRDLKSLEGNFVPVQVRPRAPIRDTGRVLLNNSLNGRFIYS